MGHKARAKKGPTDVPAALTAALSRFRGIDLPWAGAEAISKEGPVWKMREPNVDAMSSLYLPGTLLVQTGRHDGGFLLVRGDLHCRNLVVASGFTLVCTGSLFVQDSIIATAGDSVTYVGGEVHARFLDSGHGAWLTVFRDDALNVENLCGYVMGGGAVVAKGRADIVSLLISEVVESEEWDSFSPEEQKEELPQRSDYLRVDDSAARRILASGKSILR